MKKTSVVIFDCDGVMFDSRRANINFYNHLLSHFGLPVMTDGSVAFVHMHTADESIRHIFKGTPYVEDALAYRMEMDYTPFITDMIMEPELKELLDILRPKVGLAVATNRSNTIGRVLESNGLDRYFDIVVSSLDVKNPKPDPESLFKILAFFSIGPQGALYVGDSSVDYETAKAASVPFMAYKNRTLDAAYHADHLMEVAGRVL
ncbi:MAG: HAD family hydrolase [Desulfobacterales bacterium]|nr:HAD family hydrolase [Desulfobacterales bacterium]